MFNYKIYILINYKIYIFYIYLYINIELFMEIYWKEIIIDIIFKIIWWYYFFIFIILKNDINCKHVINIFIELVGIYNNLKNIG